MKPHEILGALDTFMDVVEKYELEDEDLVGVAKEFKGSLPPPIAVPASTKTITLVHAIVDELLEEVYERQRKDRRSQNSKEETEDRIQRAREPKRAKLLSNQVEAGEPRTGSGSGSEEASTSGTKAKPTGRPKGKGSGKAKGAS